MKLVRTVIATREGTPPSTDFIHRVCMTMPGESVRE